MNQFDHHSGQHYKIEGADIYYEEIGTRDKPALILLHGGFGNIEDFNLVVPHLTDHFRIIGIDSRGHGKSTMGAEKLTYERISLDVTTLLHAAEIESATIMGFSDGATVAYRLAIDSGIEIQKFITIGGTWNINDSLSTEQLFLKITAESIREVFPHGFDKYQNLNPEPDFERLTKSLVAMWLDDTSAGFPNDNVKKINCPTLIVRGDNDHLFSRESVVELAGKINNSALLNIAFAGHSVHEDQLETFIKSLRQFLNLD